ncbi:HK97-gp10 family putative phage morphogenesis protein [Taklimakanibacter deserti]|uniref:HK97-gp10 family putative phage morphogenesis protein n=1 Tax=Taklimakanibacter deserti TaxID=2267839 RepID=UPI000E65037E
MAVKIRNKDRLLHKLGILGPELRASIEAANLESANEMVALAKEFVPVHTGKLRDSIVVTGPGEQTPAYSQGGGDLVPEGAYAVSAGNSATRYAHLVEFGTKSHTNAGLFEGSDNPGTRARPFFWPAYRFIRKKMRSRLGIALNRGIKSALGTGKASRSVGRGLAKATRKFAKKAGGRRSGARGRNAKGRFTKAT